MMMEENTVPDEINILDPPPEAKYYLCPFGSNDVRFSLTARPCWWFRIWLRAFLGWKFEPIEKPGETNENLESHSS